MLGVAGVLYTIPSLAAFTLLVTWLGLFSLWTALIPLITYNLYILIRAVLVGLDGVDRSVLDASTGMGYRPTRRLFEVELPLAMPSMLAGLRLATVTTVGLVTVTAVLGAGRLRPADLRRPVQLLPHAGHRRHHRAPSPWRSSSTS